MINILVIPVHINTSDIIFKIIYTYHNLFRKVIRKNLYNSNDNDDYKTFDVSKNRK